ncbi:MAG: sulfurtransferase [Gammaproteobacteria bacterium]
MTARTTAPDWLAEPGRLLEPEDLAALPPEGVLIVHVAGAGAYQSAHVPGAVLVEPGELVAGTPPAPGRLPDIQRLTRLFQRLGYSPDLTIVAYDDEGGGWAGRFLWTLDVIGHTRWAYLNGGIQAWYAAGQPIEQGPPRAPQAGVEPLVIHVDTGPIAEIPDVLATLDNPDAVVWDARSEAEYLGLRSGSQRAGRVPGAVNLDWLALMDPARELRLVADLPTRLAAHGITPDKHVITHCQTHHRSGLTYLAARLLGFPRIQAYHGSWGEWGNRADTPIVTGQD